jgi:hypothetical protein
MPPPSPKVAQGATFSFPGISGKPTRVTVESQTPEIVNMTAASDGADKNVLVPTGVKTGGSVTVEFFSSGDPTTSIGTLGQLRFTSDGFSASKQVILESVSVSAQAGDVVKGTAKFLFTDYYQNG